MANTIRLKRSALAGKIPATTDLTLGEIAVNTTDGKLYIKKSDGGEFIVEVGPVTSVANRTGAVTLVKADVGLSNVDNTSDAAKPISNATQAALDGKASSSHGHAIADVASLQSSLDAKAPLASAALTGTPTAPTPSQGNNSTRIATTAYVDTLGATKAASSHAHAVADVTNLQTSLDGKAAGTLDCCGCRRPAHGTRPGNRIPAQCRGRHHCPGQSGGERSLGGYQLTMAIRFVGGATAGYAGAFSGNSALALNAGLTGGTRSSVQQGDLVIAVLASAATVNATLSITSGYTLAGTELYSNGSNFDTNLRVAYKFMGATPDTSTTFGPSGATDSGKVTAVFVFSGVDPVTPLDAAVASATGAGQNYPDPGPITPVTSGAVILCIGAMSEGNGSAGLSNNGQYSTFSYVSGDDDNDIHLGLGIKMDWVGGAFDPAAFSGSGAENSGSWSALTIALRPAIPSGSVKVWTGSAWVAKPVKVWNGSTWVTKPLKRWNGVAWVTSNY